MTDTMPVTGGCGFIGSCFILQQMEQYPDIRLITFVPDRPGHDRRYALDSSRLCSSLGWRPACGLGNGLAGLDEAVRGCF